MSADSSAARAPSAPETSAALCATVGLDLSTDGSYAAGSRAALSWGDGQIISVRSRRFHARPVQNAEPPAVVDRPDGHLIVSRNRSVRARAAGGIVARARQTLPVTAWEDNMQAVASRAAVRGARGAAVRDARPMAGLRRGPTVGAER